MGEVDVYEISEIFLVEYLLRSVIRTKKKKEVSFQRTTSRQKDVVYIYGSKLRVDVTVENFTLC